MDRSLVPNSFSLRFAATDVPLGSRARTALKKSGYEAVARLQCDVVDGTIVVSGVLPSFYLKQVAQTILLRLNPQGQVENRVEVRQS